MKKQAGFAYLELLLVLAVVAALGTAGWWVYQHNKPSSTSSANQNQSGSTPQSTASTTPNGTTQNVINAIDKSVTDESNVESSAATNETAQATSTLNSASAVGDSTNAATF